MQDADRRDLARSQFVLDAPAEDHGDCERGEDDLRREGDLGLAP